MEHRNEFITIGLKTTLKAVQEDKCNLVYIAYDAEEAVTKELVNECFRKGIITIFKYSMRDMANMAGLKKGVKCSSASKLVIQEKEVKNIPNYLNNERVTDLLEHIDSLEKVLTSYENIIEELIQKNEDLIKLVSYNGRNRGEQ